MRIGGYRGALRPRYVHCTPVCAQWHPRWRPFERSGPLKVLESMFQQWLAVEIKQFSEFARRPNAETRSQFEEFEGTAVLFLLGRGVLKTKNRRQKSI